MKKFQVGDYVNYGGQKVKVVTSWSDGDMELAGYRGYKKQHMYEKWVEPTIEKAKKVASLGFFGKGLLKAKMKFPQGVTLNEHETNYIIESWEHEKSLVKTKQGSLQSVSEKIEKHLAKTESDISESLKNLKTAKTYYLKTTNPVTKRKWAKKVVVRTAYYEQVRKSHLSLSSTVERVKDAVDDAQYVYKTIESRIAEAKIYRELNGGLTLVGKALQEARTKHLLPEVEYQNLEVSMEAIEATVVSGKDDTAILLEAETIVNDTARWSSEDESKKKDNTPKTTKRTTTRKTSKSEAIG
jgi:hypothetical protein